MPPGVVDVRRPVGVDIEFDVLRQGKPLFPKIKVLDHEGAIAFNAMDTDERWLQPSEPGTYVATAWIPGNLLNEGSAIVEAAICSIDFPKLEHHAAVYEAVSSRCSTQVRATPRAANSAASGVVWCGRCSGGRASAHDATSQQRTTSSVSDHPTPWRTSQQVEHSASPIEAVEQLGRRLWRAEVRLAESRRMIAESNGRLRRLRLDFVALDGAPSALLGPPRQLGPASSSRSESCVVDRLAAAPTPPSRATSRDRRGGARAERATAPASYARWVAEHDTLGASDVAGMAALYGSLDRAPLVSVLMPVFDAPEQALRAAIESVCAQAYENWELCIADDASSAPHVRTVLDEYAARDPRVKVVRRPHNGGISASNSALELARGTLVALLDHDDLLRPHSLLLSALPFLDDSRVGFVYSDADRVDVEGRRISHYFKPDWSPSLLLCQNYLCHLSVIRTELIRAVGGFRRGFDGSQDWDLALRVTERLPPGGVVHVPHVLYHWRAIEGSMASEGLAAKPYAADAARRAVEEHLVRVGRPGYVLPVGDHQKVRFFAESPPPPVSVVVPSTGQQYPRALCRRAPPPNDVRAARGGRDGRRKRIRGQRDA